MRTIGHRAAWLVMALLGCAALLNGRPAAAQSVLDGYWNPIYDEDIERIPGEDQGDYTGLPLTAAAIHVAQSWDPEVDTLPWLECRPHPSVYGLRGIGTLRIWEEIDPQTLKQIALHTWMQVWETQRQIWMDGRGQPPPWAAHTWQGFSTGRWYGDVLMVHTEAIKRAWTRRNGPPTSDEATMEERFFRDGDILTYVRMIDDPQYLSEPAVTSTNYLKVENIAMAPYPCREVTEIPRREGAIPMHMPNQTAVEIEGAVRDDVPLAAWHGGARTLLPEYQEVMTSLPPNPPLAQVVKRAAEEDEADRAQPTPAH